MQDEKQFEQLMMQYTQWKNGSEEISKMIDNEDYDNAITMIKNREQLFLSCKCMRKYLELTPVQQKELDTLLDEIRDLEMKNINKLEAGKERIQAELKQSQKTQKIQQAYEFNTDVSGSILNIKE